MSEKKRYSRSSKILIPLLEQKERHRLWTERKRFKVVVAGRRSGKTEIAKRWMVKSLFEKKKWKDPRYFVGAPTKSQAKRIFWNDFKEYIPHSYIKKIYEADLCIKTTKGSELWLFGMEKAQRVEGTSWDGCVLDEYADMKSSVWSENVMPALVGRKGWCWLIGVPNGLNHFKDLADYAKSGEDGEWGFYSWRSSDILLPEEIASVKKVLDERTFRQEFEASFEGAIGRVYYSYDQKQNESSEARLEKKLPIILCCDFNVEICVWELCQTDGHRVWVFDEVAIKNASTMEMGKEVLKRYKNHEKGVIVFGDAAGNARTTAGKSDYAILHSLGLKNQQIRRRNPFVKDRVNAVNAMLKSASGEVRLTHHPKCKYLRKDFETVTWLASGIEIDKRDAEKTHASDALGYFVAEEFALKIKAPNDAKLFYK